MRAFRSSLRQQCSFPPFEPWDNKIFPFFLRSALRILGLFYYAGFDVILIITTLLAMLVLYAAIGFNFGVETSSTTRVKELEH